QRSGSVIEYPERSVRGPGFALDGRQRGGEPHCGGLRGRRLHAQRHVSVPVIVRLGFGPGGRGQSRKDGGEQESEAIHARIAALSCLPGAEGSWLMGWYTVLLLIRSASTLPGRLHLRSTGRPGSLPPGTASGGRPC